MSRRDALLACLGELLAEADAATPGPWLVHHDDITAPAPAVITADGTYTLVAWPSSDREDAEFIASHSPDLMGEVWRGLRDEVERHEYIPAGTAGVLIDCAAGCERVHLGLADDCDFVARWADRLGVGASGGPGQPGKNEGDDGGLVGRRPMQSPSSPASRPSGGAPPAHDESEPDDAECQYCGQGCPGIEGALTAHETCRVAYSAGLSDGQSVTDEIAEWLEFQPTRSASEFADLIRRKAFFDERCCDEHPECTHVLAAVDAKFAAAQPTPAHAEGEPGVEAECQTTGRLGETPYGLGYMVHAYRRVSEKSLSVESVGYVVRVPSRQRGRKYEWLAYDKDGSLVVSEAYSDGTRSHTLWLWGEALSGRSRQAPPASPETPAPGEGVAG